MKKKSIILFLISSIVLISISSVFAFYMLKKREDINITTGKIEKGFITYKYVDGETIKEITEETIGYNSSTNSIKTYASERKATDLENYLQSNSLVVNITIKTSIAIKLRIKIQDVWESEKTYTSGLKKINTISRQWLDDNKVFTFDNNWTYDSNTGYAYYNQIIDESEEEQTIQIIGPNDYFYNFETTSVGYRETVFLTLSFNIDAVQANRADLIWGK